MIKFARYFYPPKYFDNFEEVVNSAYTDIVDICKLVKKNISEYGTSKINESQLQEIQNKFLKYNFKSSFLNVTVPFRIEFSVLFGGANMVFQNRRDQQMGIYIPWRTILYYPNKYISMGIQQFTNIVAHELQHFIDYHFLGKSLDEHGKDIKKEPLFTKYNELNFDQYKNYVDYIKYVNHPREVRANLVQLIHILNLPKDKKIYQNYVREKMANGLPASQVYVNIINNAYHKMLEFESDVIDEIRNNFLILLTPQARKYLIKGLYDAINN